MKLVKDAEVSGKRVIVRCDFDVPIKSGTIQDDSRIKNTIPTLKLLLEKGVPLILISHIDRPKGPDPSLSLKPVKEQLEKSLGEEIAFQENLEVDSKAKINLLENLRFWPQEEGNDENFSKKLSTLGDIFVNECFATAHRSHASVVGIPKFLPAYAGLNLSRELEELNKILDHPSRPLVAIIGGAKIETKLPAIFNLAKAADKILVGGKLMFEVERRSLPENVVVAHDDVDTKDIGSGSAKMFHDIISEAKMIVWNGPMGVFEEDKYMVGTKEVANSVVEANAYSVVGGGDTISALNKLELLSKINFVSTGGGAMLELLAGKTLPGLKVLE
ncbi:MAG: hypothetical protein A2Z11_03715 [Candidatus Woykebacteria bacterium RBG_16_43_9]|uniref:Phosphoglycerate kinase n=1 Tax=Candidatus Woykebacteria bacterium RBG_16_43_9 TaxID=1802596 RepID=A0A1G1WE02_9BACT|nr:MAG: hypothetical protein A2Z11_03715 [Candidatus Woykebacteria bacterium RBG_16_43_9]